MLTNIDINSPYPIITAPVDEQLTTFLGSFHYSTLFVLCDENTATHCYPKVKAFLPSHQLVTVAAGESHKSVESASQIWSQLLEHQADRQSLLITLGGGMIGDLGGFCASSYMRGIRFILMPTSLLAMVDASIGGKLGINYENIKNAVGLFNYPEAVWVDSTFLNTLPPEEWLSGLGEITKHHLLDNKPLSSISLAPDHIDSVIEQSIRFKSTIVQQDFKDNGLRQILNLGHTIGHAFESYLLNRGEQLPHGIAIAAGLVSESYIAEALYPSPSDTNHWTVLRDYVSEHFPSINVGYAALPDIWYRMQKDKKNQNGQVNMVLQDSKGNIRYPVAVTKEQVYQALRRYIDTINP